MTTRSRSSECMSDLPAGFQCQQHTVDRSGRCYYHAKIAKGLLKPEERSRAGRRA